MPHRVRPDANAYFNEFNFIICQVRRLYLCYDLLNFDTGFELPFATCCHFGPVSLCVSHCILFQLDFSNMSPSLVAPFMTTPYLLFTREHFISAGSHSGKWLLRIPSPRSSSLLDPSSTSGIDRCVAMAIWDGLCDSSSSIWHQHRNRVASC